MKEDSSREELSPRFRPAPVALSGVALALTLFGCGSASTPPPEDPPAPPVEALEARSGSLPLEERLNGVVRADNQVVVRPEVSGRVVEVLVESGDAVTKGQALVRIETQGLRDQLRQAEADLRLAKASAAEARARRAELEAEVTRTRRLASEALVSELQLETLEARLEAAGAVAEQAEAGVEQAAAVVDERRFDLGRAVVRAPSSGRVGRREVEVGTLAGPDTALFVLGNLDDLLVEVPLSEAMLAYIEVGHPVRITPRDAAAEAEPLRASLTRISPFLERGSFTTTAEIDLEGVDSALRPGMFVNVDVLYGESETATLVPTSALWEDPRSGVEGIYVFTESPAGAPEQVVDAPPEEPSDKDFAVELRSVRVVAEGRAVLGVEGVEPGEWVVVLGQNLLAGSDAPRARVRSTGWPRVLELQDLQRENLLADFHQKQRRLAQERGAEPPSNAEYLASARAAVSGGQP